jgi:hypothetical protein
VPRHPRKITDEQRRHIAAVIVEAGNYRARVSDAGPDPVLDPIGAIAWSARILGTHAPETVELVRWAKFVGRLEWREIALAVQVDPDDLVAVKMIANSYRYHMRES